MAKLRQVIAGYLGKKGTAIPDLEHFLPYHDPWPSEAEPEEATDSRYSAIDRTFLANL